MCVNKIFQVIQFPVNIRGGRGGSVGCAASRGCGRLHGGAAGVGTHFFK